MNMIIIKLIVSYSIIILYIIHKYYLITILYYIIIYQILIYITQNQLNKLSIYKIFDIFI